MQSEITMNEWPVPKILFMQIIYYLSVGGSESYAKTVTQRRQHDGPYITRPLT